MEDQPKKRKYRKSAKSERTLLERFWSKVDKTDSCWLWTGSLHPKGYGMFRLNTHKTKQAHIVAFTLTHGDVPEGKMVDHKCHVKNCVNPDHLRAATRKQNGENRGALTSSNKSGYRGVHWDKAHQKWRAGVRHNGKVHWAGRFDSPEDANKAVIAKRRELFTHSDQDN